MQGIPAGISHEDVLTAIRDLSRGIEHPFGPATKFHLMHEGAAYPPKAVIGLAARRLSGRVLQPSEFSSGELRHQAVGYLRDLGFEVVSEEARRAPTEAPAPESSPAIPAFSPWTPWGHRDQIADAGLPGIYALARYEQPPPSRVDITAAAVVYIGETCAALWRRWYQFERSAFRRKDGHSGGWTFGDTYMNGEPGDPPNWLWVAACPIALEEPYASACIRYTERWAIWEFVRRHGRMPECNRK